MSNLFRRGSFILASHKPAWWKIDCDALTDEDWGTIAAVLAHHLPEFGSVEGVPRGGLRLAEALQGYVTRGPLLVVDDVWTTGGSWRAHCAGREALGAVAFARGILPPDVVAFCTVTA